MPVLCECITGFIPKSQQDWEELNWASGCIRKTKLNCTEGDKFLETSEGEIAQLVAVLDKPEHES
jgi:hypothetical protein